MTTSVASILAKARRINLDSSGVRWDDDELVGWLNDGQLEVVIHKPTASTTRGPISLVAGTVQTIPAGGIRLLKISHNTGDGSAVTLVSKEDLQQILPSWANAAATVAAEHYMVDEDFPGAFDVYPPNTGAGEVFGTYSEVPATIPDALANISLADEYEPALLDYLEFRMWTKHSNDPGNDRKAEAAYQRFLRRLGVKMQADITFSPKRDQEGNI